MLICIDCFYCRITQLSVGSSYNCRLLDIRDIVYGSVTDEPISFCREERKNKFLLDMLSEIGFYRKRCGLEGKNFKSKPVAGLLEKKVL